jgi:hypothetical protein
MGERTIRMFQDYFFALFFSFQTQQGAECSCVGKEEIEDRDQGLAIWRTCAGRTWRLVSVQGLKMSSSVLVRTLALSPYNRAVVAPRIYPRRRDRGLEIKD